MGEHLFKKSRLAPFVAMGASALALTGCVVANVDDTSSFVFGCPPKAPDPKVGQGNYKSLPGNKGKVAVDVSCVNSSTGLETAPLRVEDNLAGTFATSVNGEQEYRFNVNYGVNIDNGNVELSNSHSPVHPDMSVVTMQGDIVNFQNVDAPFRLIVN